MFMQWLVNRCRMPVNFIEASNNGFLELAWKMFYKTSAFKFKCAAFYPFKRENTKFCATVFFTICQQ